MVNERVRAASQSGSPLDPSLLAALAEKAMAAGGRKEKKAEPTDAEVSARIHTLDGARFFVWYRLHQADRAVTRQWVDDLIADDAARDEVMAAFLDSDGFRHLDPKKA